MEYIRKAYKYKNWAKKLIVNFYTNYLLYSLYAALVM